MTRRVDLFLALLVVSSLSPAFLLAQVPITHPTLNFLKSFGGEFTDASAIALDLSGNIYIAGSTTSPNFATKSAYQQKLGGANLRVSADGGVAWGTPNIPSPVYAVSNSPQRPNVIFAGTDNGVYESIDSGKTWRLIPSFPSVAVEALLVDAQNPDIIVAATLNGIYRSADAGSTWNQIILGIPPVVALASSPARPAATYSATNPDFGVVTLSRSGDSVGAWVDTTNFIDPTMIDAGSVYLSPDHGATWSKLPNAPSHVFALACDPVDPNVVYAAASGYAPSQYFAFSLFKTIDGGATWVRTADLQISYSTFTLAVTHTAVFLGTPTGVRISRDGGVTFAGTTVTSAADNIAIDPSNPNVVYADADRLYRSADGGATWSVALDIREQVNTLAVLPTVPTSVFVGTVPGQNAFVTKWSPDGSQILYSTYLGGSNQEVPTALAIDNQGNAIVTGYSYSLDFPVTSGALQAKNRGTANAFLAKIGPGGDKLLYSTYLGGSGADAAKALALDSSGNPHITGYAGSPDFPITPGAEQTILKNKCNFPHVLPTALGDAFVTKIDIVTGKLAYSTFLGGSCGDEGLGIVVDQSGIATVVGQTQSSDFPVEPAPAKLQQVSSFLVRLTPQGQIAKAMPLPGIDGPSTAVGVTLDSAGDIYVTGSANIGNSSSAASLLTGPLGDVGLPEMDVGSAYVLKLDRQNLQRLYVASTGGVSSGKSIKVDSLGRAWIAGTRYDFGSDDPFPLIAPFQAYVGITFVAQFSADGSNLLFSSATYDAQALTLSSNSVFVAGMDYKTAGAQLIRLDMDTVRSVSVNAPERLFSSKGSASGEGVVPGEFIAITGMNLGPVQLLTAQPDQSGAFPTTLAGTSVLFDGLPAQLLSVSANRVVCVVPFAIDPGRLHLTNMQLISTAGKANPVLLGEMSSPVALMAAVNADGSPNAESTPAAPGSVLTIYGSGFGQTDPPTVDGVSAAALPRTFLAGAPFAAFHNAFAPISYIGAAPGQLTAVTQINLKVPIGLAPGHHLLEIGIAPASGTLDIFVGQ